MEHNWDGLIVSMLVLFASGGKFRKKTFLNEMKKFMATKLLIPFEEEGFIQSIIEKDLRVQIHFFKSC